MDTAGSAPTGIKRRTGALRSKQVLDAAEQCVQRLGFHNASMAEIAAAAGMSVGHIYRYFPSKEAIIAAIVERDAAATLAEVEALECDPAGVRAALLAHARRFIDRCAEPDRLALTLEVMAEAARNPAIARVIRDGFGEVQARIFALIRRDRPDLSEAELRRRMDAFDVLLAGLPVKALKTPGFDRAGVADFVRECVDRIVSD